MMSFDFPQRVAQWTYPPAAGLWLSLYEGFPGVLRNFATAITSFTAIISAFGKSFPFPGNISFAHYLRWLSLGRLV